MTSQCIYNRNKVFTCARIILILNFSCSVISLTLLNPGITMLTDQSSQAFVIIKMLNKLLLDLSEFSSNILQCDIVITELILLELYQSFHNLFGHDIHFITFLIMQFYYTEGQSNKLYHKIEFYASLILFILIQCHVVPIIFVDVISLEMVKNTYCLFQNLLQNRGRID